jgi:ribosome production factor 1
MGVTDGDISGVKNKIVRGQLLARQKKEKAQNKLQKRIARKEAENRGEVVERGWTRTIENTKEWLGDDENYADPRTRPAKVEVDEATGDVRVDLGTLATLFPPSANASWDPNSGVIPPPEPKILITTSPGKPPSLMSKDFLVDLQALWGGKGRADIVPRKSPKFELGKVARWAKGRGYGAIAVVGEDHSKPSSSFPFSSCVNVTNADNLDSLATLTLSLLPNGPTAHFRLTGITLCREIKVRFILYPSHFSTQSTYN